MSASRAPRGHLRRRIMLVVRLVFVPMALVAGWFLARSQGLELRPTGGIHLLLLALATNQVAILLIGWRMSVGLRLFGIDLRSFDALRIAIQSQFYFFFVPISASNEVSRYLKIKAVRPETTMHSLVAALLLDRVMGLLACVAMAAAVIPWLRVDPIAGIRVPPIGASVIATVAVGAAILVAWRFGWLAALGRAWDATRGRRRLIVPATALVLLMQSCTIVAVWCAARWLGVDAPLAVLAVGISLGTLGQIVPFTFAGAGPAEVAGLAVFMAMGLAAPEAGTLAALVYLTRLMAAVEGGIWEVVDGAQSMRSPAEVFR